jgi:polysaccharide pyruvyl transferase WcaK-like protein
LQKEQDLPQLEPFMKAWQSAGRKALLLDVSQLERPSQWVSLMRQFDLVVAMRLHALIFALKEGVPVMGLTYDAKVEHVLNQFGQPILILPKEEDDAALAKKWLDTALAGLQDLEKLRLQARENAESAKKLACRNFQLLAKILDIKK